MVLSDRARLVTTPADAPRASTLVVILPFAVLGGALAWLCYRGEPNVGFDSHYYLEYVKRFTHELPESFGTHWPFGYPLLGAAVHHLGASAYTSLLLVSLAGLLATLALAWQILRETTFSRPARLGVLGAIACASVTLIELGTLRSEIVFTALYLAFFVSLAHWPMARAMAATPVLLVLGFSIRYAGILAFGPLIGWMAVNWQAFSRAKVRGRAIGIVLLALAACLALLALNRSASGYLSGGERSQSASLATLPDLIADMGWSGVVAVTTFGVYSKAASFPWIARMVGWLAFAALLGLAFEAWRENRNRFARPLALGLAGYLTGMVALRFTQDFDSLHNARTFIPVLAITLCLLAAAHPRLTTVFTAVVVATGGLVAVRGLSPEIKPAFAAPLRILEARVTRSDVIGVNEAACGFSAWTDCTVVRIDAGPLERNPPRFTLLAAERKGRPPIFEQAPSTRAYSRRLRAASEQTLIFSNAEFEVWERTQQ